MKNIFAIGIIIILTIYIYGLNETKKPKTKLDKKQKYMVKMINKLSKPTKPTKPTIEPNHLNPTLCEKTMELISAYAVGCFDDNYNNQPVSSKLLQSIDTDEIKGRDFIKTNFVDIENSIVVSPSPAPSLVPSPAPASVFGVGVGMGVEFANTQNEIIGITNAPMYAPVESIDKSVDIFLINQINTTKNNSLSYLDHLIFTSNNKMNYIKNNPLVDCRKSVENVDGYSKNEFKYSGI